MKKFVDPMQPDTFYHIYNRACGFDKLFKEDKNYYFFLDLFAERLSGIIDLYCYCLVPNHFHMLIKTRSPDDQDSEDYNYSKLLGNIFAAYAQSFNHYYFRKGSLFSQNFRRKAIETDNYLRTVVIYIHRNPVKHNLVENISDWKFSSYLEHIQSASRYCITREVLAWFGTRDMFRFSHSFDPESDIE